MRVVFVVDEFMGDGSSLFYFGEDNNVISYDGMMVFCFSFLIYCRSKNTLA